MATRKKKEYASEDIPIATDAKMFKNSKWPKINKGTHLTVKTYDDGRTELEWDDEQLLKEVREAIASVNKPKKSTKGKKNGST